MSAAASMDAATGGEATNHRRPSGAHAPRAPPFGSDWGACIFSPLYGVTVSVFVSRVVKCQAVTRHLHGGTQLCVVLACKYVSACPSRYVYVSNSVNLLRIMLRDTVVLLPHKIRHIRSRLGVGRAHWTLRRTRDGMASEDERGRAHSRREACGSSIHAPAPCRGAHPSSGYEI